MLVILNPLMRIIEIPMMALQRLLGVNRLAWVFLLPNLLLFGLFAFLPVILNLSYSLTGGDNVLLEARPYVGGRNFETLTSCSSFLDPNTCIEDKFWRAVWNTLWFVTLQVGIMVGFALLTAIILNRDIRARGFFRSVFFFPVLLSPVVVALIWKWILQREGVLNAFLDWIGIGGFNWLIDAEWAFAWTVFLSVWAHMGFYTLILLAGLQAIPRDVYEAALMDRASPWRTFRRITLPLLSPTMLVVLVLALIKGVQTFDEVYAFTGGGPGTATTFIIQYIYEEGFAGAPRLFGLAAAASLMVAIVLVVLTLIQLWINRRNVDG
ncbi:MULTISPECIES: carbohydrate ABC transporter permease [Paracoccaceae]|jgi:alpha-1,4-digalacturonate transport system permease protein|uniref:carbohydrate ABC transporter permease n=1 Tax=Rhodobacterales TaxID=204455 RepID=UPI001B0DD872|nr:sugar ABC transporter permease [Boseongicola sp. H5]MBO6604579.1 sugar ABC transporter permease [Roseicyclus sp.]MBO6626739.1 sugar ABC transporter permease [Roseicyclus sp.]MBO6921280.1 sugar ABC transporter permease [Roseicyclus sp.]